MKRLLVILFALVLCVSTIPPATASPSPTLTVANAQATPGESFDIQVSMSNNPGIVNMMLTVDYDSSVLTLSAVKDGGILGSSMHSPDYSLDPYQLTWANDTASSDFKTNGVLATLSFKVKEGAQSGDYAVTLSYDNSRYDIVNYAFQTVDFELKQGSVRVLSGSPSTPAPTAAPTPTPMPTAAPTLSTSPSATPTPTSTAPELLLEKAEVKPGETVELKLRMSNNPGIVNMMLTVDYDSSVLTLTAVKDGGILGSSMHSPDYSLDPYQLTWANDTASSDFKTNGVLATLSFKVKEGAQSGDYAVTLSYDNSRYDIVNYAFQTVDFELKQGSVRVLSGSPSTPAPAIIWGDANDDGSVTAADAAKILRFLVELDRLAASGLAAADCDGSPGVTAADAAAILRYLVELEPKLPVG